MITAAEIQTIRNNDPGAVLPGIDTMTGNPYATSSLLDVTKITQNTKAPYYYSPSSNTVIRHSGRRGAQRHQFRRRDSVIDANNVTIEDCTFTGHDQLLGCRPGHPISGATVENCTFTGTKSPTENNVWIVSKQGHHNRGQQLSEFASRLDRDSRKASSPATTSPARDICTGAHADAIYVPETTGPVTITDNFIDETPNAGAPGNSNTDIRITNEGGANTAM